MKLDISINSLRAEGGKVLAEALNGNQVMTELNISSNYLSNFGRDRPGIIALAETIPSMRALSSLNLARNDLVPMVLPDGWTTGWDNDYIEEPTFKHADGRRQKADPSQPDFTGVIALRDAIKNSQTLLKFTFGDKQVVTMASDMTEADFSSKLRSYAALPNPSFA
jgi:hypothetical protein